MVQHAVLKKYLSMVQTYYSNLDSRLKSIGGVQYVLYLEAARVDITHYLSKKQIYEMLFTMTRLAYQEYDHKLRRYNFAPLGRDEGWVEEEGE